MTHKEMVNPDDKQLKEHVLNWNLFSKYRTELMGIAAICILFFHMTMNHGNGMFCADIILGDSIINTILYLVINQLNIGVEIFLFVSGIGLYYAYEKKPNFKEYYIKRIVNVYLTAIIISLFFRSIPFILLNDFNLKSFVLSVFSLKWILGISLENWYVSFAMIMYLIYPLLYKLIKKFEGRKYTKIVIALILVLYMQLLWYIKNTVFYETYEIGLTRIPIFISGCYAGYLVKNNKKITWEVYLLAIIGVTLKAYFYKGYTYDIQSRLSSFFFAFFILLFAICFLNIMPQFILKALKWIGNMSLELYLVHIVFAGICLDYFPEYCNTITYLITVIAAIPISWGISKFRIFIIGKYNNYLKAKSTKQEVTNI